MIKYCSYFKDCFSFVLNKITTGSFCDDEKAIEHLKCSALIKKKSDHFVPNFSAIFFYVLYENQHKGQIIVETRPLADFEVKKERSDLRRFVFEHNQDFFPLRYLKSNYDLCFF